MDKNLNTEDIIALGSIAVLAALSITVLTKTALKLNDRNITLARRLKFAEAFVDNATDLLSDEQIAAVSQKTSEDIRPRTKTNLNK